MILKLILDLPEEQPFIKITRLLGRTLLEHLKVTQQDTDEIETVVGELCANVVRHSHSTEHRFQVGLEYYADHLVILVADKGTGFAPSEVAPVGTLRPDFAGGDRIGGYGLRLVELMSDRLEFQQTDPRGTTVRAEKRLHFDTPADAEKAASLNAAGGAQGGINGLLTVGGEDTVQSAF